jgi:trimethylamine--corrinoid protein Co-methyltransferase
LVLGVAEVLGGLVIGQAAHENARPLIFIAPGALDMRSMLMDVSSPMRLNLSVAATQMVSQFYGLPCAANCGKTAASATGVQAGYEKALSILYPVLAGATSVGPIGQVENGFVFSFRQLVIDHEIARFVKRLLRGVSVTEDTLALDPIEEVGPGRDFVSLPHTVAHFRQELWISDVGEFAGHEPGAVETHRGAGKKALEKARTILATHDPHPLSKEQEAEIDRIVARALLEMA